MAPITALTIPFCTWVIDPRNYASSSRSGVTSVCDSMTVSDGAVRSHRTAPTHAVTTHPMPITPHHVINAIATPIGPNPFHPLSNGGERILVAKGGMILFVNTSVGRG